MPTDLCPITARMIVPLAGQKLEVISLGTASTALDVIGVARGSEVAQVGLGAENFALRLAERVGPDGKVFVSDTQKPNLDRLKRTLASHGLGNVKFILGAEDDPHLPAGKLDLLLLVGKYQELTQPQDTLRRLSETLKPGGRLVLIEYRQDDPSAPMRGDHRLTLQDLRSDVEAAGYRFEKLLGVLPRQNILVFARADSR